MKVFNDAAVSELLGYTVLVAIVSIAAVGLLTGGMGTLTATEKRMELDGSVNSIKSLASLAEAAVETNNTFFSAQELSVPSGNDLAVRDKHDDFRSVSIYNGNQQLAFLPLGSVVISSQFRSVCFEGGAVISNDTGLLTADPAPAIYTVRLSPTKQALYVSLVSISSDSFVSHSGPATLYVRCSSVTPMIWHLTGSPSVIVRVASDNAAAWGNKLEGCGFNVTYGDGSMEASDNEITNIYVTYSEVEVKNGGR